MCKEKNSLAAYSTIRKWFRKVDCTPGLTEIALRLLQIKAEEASKLGTQLLCSFMSDEMSNYEQDFSTQVLVF